MNFCSVWRERNELEVMCSTCSARWHRSQGDAINIDMVIKRLSGNEGWGGVGVGYVRPGSARSANTPLFLLHSTERPSVSKGSGGDFGLGLGMMASKVLTKIEMRVCVRACVCMYVRENALSVVVQGSGEDQIHPSAGLTNSRANTHFAVPLKSKGSKLSVTAPEKKETPLTEKTQREGHNGQSGASS